MKKKQKNSKHTFNFWKFKDKGSVVLNEENFILYLNF